MSIFFIPNYEGVVIILYRKLDIDDDYSFGKGQQCLTYGIYAVKQAIKTRLKLLKNEWWENTDEGLPLFQSILGKPGTNNNLSVADALIKERIIGTQDVTSLEDFSSTYENRSYVFSCSINTKYGTTTVEDSL